MQANNLGKRVKLYKAELTNLLSCSFTKLLLTALTAIKFEDILMSWMWFVSELGNNEKSKLFFKQPCWTNPSKFSHSILLWEGNKRIWKYEVFGSNQSLPSGKSLPKSCKVFFKVLFSHEDVVCLSIEQNLHKAF